MKFGGTSIGSASRIIKASEIISSQIKNNPIVVVSALSGITNALVALSQEASQNKNINLVPIFSRHKTVIKELDLPHDLLKDDFNELISLFNGISLLQECTKRTHDRILSFGEHCSSKIVASFLEKKIEKKVVPICSYQLGLQTDSNFGCAIPLKNSSETIKKSVNDHKDKLFVTTGFIAKDKNGNITTLGRGGSDFSASYIGAAIDAKEIQIWTDVSGILTADPKMVKTAKPLLEVSFEEASELAYYGAKVIHPSTMIPAMSKNIPVRILNTNQPEHPGTIVYKERKLSESIVKAIAHRDGLRVINIVSPRMLNQYGFLSQIFNIFSHHKVSVDMVTTSEVSVSLTVTDDQDISLAVEELKEISEVTVENSLSVVSVVGEGLREAQFISSQVFAVLKENKIPVRMISLGASKINLSFLVDSKQVLKAVTSLHQEFFSI